MKNVAVTFSVSKPIYEWPLTLKFLYFCEQKTGNFSERNEKLLKTEVQKFVRKYFEAPSTAHKMNTLLKNRSSPPGVFLGKGVLKICNKFTGEHPC